VDYPKHDRTLKVHGSPWHFSETPAQVGVAPVLGEHNNEVLAALGYSAEQIGEFRARGVI
jgi:crotonobetainyl-CoA:carnitine CoA-transferase CaiB-like acyl-CoA transferase